MLKFWMEFNGYYPNEQENLIITKIASQKPDILLIANSSPKKELFAFENKERVNAKVIVPCGGMVDVLAGDISLTPTWLKKIGFGMALSLYSRTYKKI